MLGKHYLCAVVTQEEVNWLTPQSGDVTGSTREAVVMWANGQRPKTSDQRLRTQVAAEQLKHGQAAPASSNTLGSRQGLWPTPCANNPNEGETLESWDRRQALNKAKHNNGNGAGTPLAIKVKQELWLTPKTGDNHATKHHPQRSDGGQPNLAWQMEKEQFPTPRTCDWKSSGPNGHQGTYLAGAVKQWMTPRACEAQNPPMGVDKRHHGLTHQVTKQWATPRSGKTTDENPETWALRQAKGDVATMPLGAQVKCWGTPAANDANKTPHCEVNSNQAGLAKSVGLELQRQWGTPTASDHKSGRGNEDREYKELTPMVERAQAGKLNQNWVCCLMGVPMGWVDPLCPVSVIKNWPRFVSGWVRPQTAPIPCDSLAMELSRQPQSELSEFSLAS
jgi:hypothetical protein